MGRGATVPAWMWNVRGNLADWVDPGTEVAHWNVVSSQNLVTGAR